MMKKTKPKKCKACGVLYTPFSSLQKACSVGCSLQFVKNEKAEDFRKSSKKALNEFNRKDLKWQHSQTQPVFNKMRRLQELKWFADRDLEPTCISCYKPLGNDQWCNGHFKTVGSNGRLRYEPLNSYLQHNRSCNMALSGDINGYKKGIILRFGEKEGGCIIDHCESSNSPKKYTWQEIEEIRSNCAKEIKLLNEG